MEDTLSRHGPVSQRKSPRYNGIARQIKIREIVEDRRLKRDWLASQEQAALRTLDLDQDRISLLQNTPEGRALLRREIGIITDNFELELYD